MKLKYEIAMVGATFLLLVGTILIYRFGPKFVWDFFSAETSPVNLAIFRIIFFPVLAASTNVYDVVWFSRIPAELKFPPTGLSWLLQILPINETWAATASLCFLLFCFTATIGLFTRTSAILCAVLGFYVLGIPQFYGKINHYHHLLWFTAILAVSPCADVLSIDSIWKSWKRADSGLLVPPGPSLVYALPLRFIWLLMGSIYFSAGFWKVWTSGYKWAFSENPKIMLYDKWMELGGWRPVFRIDLHPVLYQLSAAATILFELTFIFIIFFPAIRLLAPMGGLAFHSMTRLFMKISFWQLQFCYVSFVDWHKLLQFVGVRLFKQKMYVLYDGNCGICRRTIASLGSLELFNRISYLNALDEAQLIGSGLAYLDRAALLRDMHAIVGTRSWSGFEAYREIAKRIPIFWPIIPFLYIWPIPLLGRRMYRHVADGRICAIRDHPSTLISRRPIRQPRSIGAIIFVGGILLYAAILTGIGKIQSWPFAAYPTFEDMDPPQVSVITMRVQSDTGWTAEINPIGQQAVGNMSAERLMALLGRILSTEDNQTRNQRLSAFWELYSRDNPQLRQVTDVRFYQETLSSLPERQDENPLSRNLLWDLQLPEAQLPGVR